MSDTTAPLGRFVNPLGQPVALAKTLAPRRPSLTGATIGLIDTGKPMADRFLDRIEVLLRADYPDVTIRRVRKDFTSSKPIAHELGAEVEAAINAWGD